MKAGELGEHYTQPGYAEQAEEEADHEALEAERVMNGDRISGGEDSRAEADMFTHDSVLERRAPA